MQRSKGVEDAIAQRRLQRIIEPQNLTTVLVEIDRESTVPTSKQANVIAQQANAYAQQANAIARQANAYAQPDFSGDVENITLHYVKFKLQLLRMRN
ncbi:hypothetical protein [Nostoc sp. CHAB 5715]|uniref:hypothetical protein n=1 Tax=Nostoc sp. CHAB 5715 TaxID=2780400 RepID=UPI001E3D07E7|nr:hypothetical protein [Nostoc sp. CHAB 5715]